jgi:hypothetical protein
VSCRRTARGYRCTVREARSGRVRLRCSGRRKQTGTRCLARARARQRGGSFLSKAGLDWQGFPSTAMSAVGRLVSVKPDGRVGRCTATVVSRTLLLTAGHCLNGNPTQVYFLPGASWGASEDEWDYTRPYGTWRASNWWTTGAWSSRSDPALDWGLVEIPPVNGRAISDSTGSWSIMPNIRFNTGARVYSVGYPASGFWKTAEGHRTRGQYACSSSWDGQWASLSNGWELYLACTMNRGASGGPWFVQLDDGTWYIGGVNNRCQSRWDYSATQYCDPHSDYMRSSYLDSRFLEFWNSVQPLRSVS